MTLSTIKWTPPPRWVKIIDRYCSVGDVSKTEFLLLDNTSLFLARDADTRRSTISMFKIVLIQPMEDAAIRDSLKWNRSYYECSAGEYPSLKL
jgi:hypothetical protein